MAGRVADTIASDPQDPPRLIARAARPQAALLLALMVLSSLTEGVGLLLLVPLLASLGAADSGTVGAAMQRIGLPLRLDLLLGCFVAVVALRALLVQWRTVQGLRFELEVVDALRRRAWAALLQCDWRVLVGMRRAETSNLLISRIDRARLFINQGIAGLSILITLGGVGLAALAISPALTLGALMAGVVVFAAFHGLRRRAEQLGTALGKAHGKVQGRLDEDLGAMRMIKGLGSEQRSLAALTGEFTDLRNASIAFQRDSARGQAALQFGGAACLAVLVWLAIERWQLGIALVLPMVALFARALPLIGALQTAVLISAHARPAVNEALALIAATEASREEPAGAAPAPVLTRYIELRGVTVRFGEEPQPALNDVDLTIPARGITALTGHSGAGKSTLADLVGGLLTPDAGSVLVDGTELAGAVRQAWRSRVAYVQQDPVLLAASLRDNLRWAMPEAEDAALIAALKAAAADFALALPQGLDTVLGDGGRQLSGGERQRLMLARALLREPALLILDEATSALDTANEAQILAALEHLRSRMAIVVIGHRGALVAAADREVRLESGRIVAPLS